VAGACTRSSKNKALPALGGSCLRQWLLRPPATTAQRLHTPSAHVPKPLCSYTLPCVLLDGRAVSSDVSTKLISKLLIVSSSKIRSQWILIWDGIDHDRLSLPLAQYVCRCHGIENYNINNYLQKLKSYLKIEKM
jgi:hypothetical protein